jgi:GAF domain-containing protein
MTSDRERQIIQAFVALSGELTEGYDVVDLLSELTLECARLLNVASAGLLLADGSGVLHVMAASSERTRHLELFQLQREEGPCLECFSSGHAVAVPDLADAIERWPQFVAAALQGGYRAVHALPMRLRGQVLGTLGLFGDITGDLGEDDVQLAQALAHVASVAVVNERAAADSAQLNSQLQTALNSRVAIEQAKGVLAEIGGLEMDQAFTALRRYARDCGARLSDVAGDVVHRRLPGRVVLDHARAAGVF